MEKYYPCTMSLLCQCSNTLWRTIQSTNLLEKPNWSQYPNYPLITRGILDIINLFPVKMISFQQFHVLQSNSFLTLNYVGNCCRYIFVFMEFDLIISKSGDIYIFEGKQYFLKKVGKKKTFYTIHFIFEKKKSSVHWQVYILPVFYLSIPLLIKIFPHLLDDMGMNSAADTNSCIIVIQGGLWQVLQFLVHSLGVIIFGTSGL